MEYIFNGTPFNLQKGDPAICNSMEESWWHYAKRNEEDPESKIYFILLIYGAKNVKNTERVEPCLLHDGKVGKCGDVM